jgi:hypothetical protein
MKRNATILSLSLIFLVSLVFVPSSTAWGQMPDNGKLITSNATLNEKYLAITDIYITNHDWSAPTPPNPSYTGVTWDLYNGKPICTVPYVQGETGTMVMPTDINSGIGGDWVYIWVKYDWVAATDSTPVLVDIAVHHWPNWNVDCPAGWEPAHGDDNGMLTTRADNACWRNGLCVRYAPMNQTETFITNLSISFTDTSEATSPSLCPANEGYWPMAQDDLDIHMGCGDGKWMYLSYNQARRWPPMPASLPTPSASEKVIDLKKYAPRVWLADYEPGHPEGEIYFPSSVEWAFAHMHREWWSAWWLYTNDPLDSPSDVLPYFHGCDGASTGSPCSLTDTPVYAFWDEVEFDVSGDWVKVADLIYFYYYPYNRGKDVLGTMYGSHVSDWEHVSVRLTPQWDEQSGWSLKPAQIYLSAHDFGRNYLWDQISKTEGHTVLLPIILRQADTALDNQTQQAEQTETIDQTISFTTHPVVYAAWGAHGLWRDPGIHDYKHLPLPWPFDTLSDWTGAGTAWDTWNLVIAFDFDTKMGLGDATWPVWMSKDYDNGSIGNTDPASGPIYRWGNDEWDCNSTFGFCRLDKGPTGPVDKGVWDIEILR